MKMKKLLPVMFVAAIALSSCAKEVTYSEFKAAVDNITAPKEAYKMAEATIKGTTKSGDTETKLSGKYDFKPVLGVWTPYEYNTTSALLAAYVNMGIGTVSESDSNKYYLDGKAFQVKTDSTTKKWNEYGYLTSYNSKTESENITVTIKWKSN